MKSSSANGESEHLLLATAGAGSFRPAALIAKSDCPGSPTTSQALASRSGYLIHCSKPQ
jgi:hypothetical protein